MTQDALKREDVPQLSCTGFGQTIFLTKDKRIGMLSAITTSEVVKVF
jgi:hypothetical protein